MVFKKIKNIMSSNDEKYEILYYKYSQVKLENQRLKEKHINDMNKYKYSLQKKMAMDLIDLFEDIENTKNSSFKVKAIDKDIQRLLLEINKVEKKTKSFMVDLFIEEYEAKERFYDPELHDVASYQESKGMKKGIILKTLKKGFKFKNKIIKKPKVVVTQ
jgi:molecular chaperone GrpE (heat shock protein)